MIPTATITNLAAAMEAHEYDLLPTFFCPEQAAQAAMFDPSALVASLALGLPEGVDTSSLGEAFSLVPSIESLEVVSQTDTEAVVKLVGTLTIDIDTTALAPFVEAMLAAQGMEVTPDMAAMMTSMLVGQFAMDPIDISDELTLVPGETMPWVLCDAFGAGTEPSVESSRRAGRDAQRRSQRGACLTRLTSRAALTPVPRGAGVTYAWAPAPGAARWTAASPAQASSGRKMPTAVQASQTGRAAATSPSATGSSRPA